MTDFEFSRPVRLERIGRKTLEQSIAASEDECRATASRLQIAALSRLSARFELEPAKDGIIAVTGTLEASVTQICVVGGESFDTEVSEPIRSRFTTDSALLEPFDIDKIDAMDEWDDIELVEGGAIDLGELAVQHLSLSLDPYPRKPDAEWHDPGASPKPASPFAVLQGLKKD